MPKIYFHVDVNSAFLSWSALKSLQDGGTVDLRTIPAVVGGDEAKRHGVVLAKSAPAKKFGIQTGESLFAARAKCPGLTIVPPDFDDVLLFDRVKQLLKPAGFARFSFTTAQAHDEMIAFTSQLAHVASNAYIKSPTAKKHKGFSAGSYKDMTRVAWLAPHMWAELFMENKEFLLKEIDCYIEHLSEYKTAMEHDDEETLIRLLDEGKKRKEEVDG